MKYNYSPNKNMVYPEFPKLKSNFDRIVDDQNMSRLNKLPQDLRKKKYFNHQKT